MEHIYWKEKKWIVSVVYNYRAGNIGLWITEETQDIISEEHIVSIKLENLEYGEIGIDDFDEKLGILEALVIGNIVVKPHRHIKAIVKDRTYSIPIVRLKTMFMNMLGIKPSKSEQKFVGKANSAKPAAKE